MHRFELGQLVRLQFDPTTRETGVYEIVRLLPAAEDGAPQYRIKAQQGVPERAVKEHQLRAIA